MKAPVWRTYVVAVVAGMAAALAMPPLFWLPLGVVGVVIFVRQWDAAATPKEALLRAWAWGWGHFAVGSYWMVEAFFVPPADFAWLGPPAVAGLAVVLGFFPAMTAVAARRLAQRFPHLGSGVRRLVVLAILWTATEWIRGHIFTGLPWNPLGHVWAFAPPLLQGAAVFGVYGLGTLTFILLAAPVAGWRASRGRQASRSCRRLIRLQAAWSCASFSRTWRKARRWCRTTARRISGT
jgi:apolipoprotein N-acyltransferase